MYTQEPHKDFRRFWRAAQIPGNGLGRGPPQPEAKMSQFTQEPHMDLRRLSRAAKIKENKLGGRPAGPNGPNTENKLSACRQGC